MKSTPVREPIPYVLHTKMSQRNSIYSVAHEGTKMLLVKRDVNQGEYYGSTCVICGRPFKLAISTEECTKVQNPRRHEFMPQT